MNRCIGIYTKDTQEDDMAGLSRSEGWVPKDCHETVVLIQAPHGVYGVFCWIDFPSRQHDPQGLQQISVGELVTSKDHSKTARIEFHSDREHSLPRTWLFGEPILGSCLVSSRRANH